LVHHYNFDFMRGDMSHVQMNPNPNYSLDDPFYDIHKYVKLHIAKQKPYFGYFAESFVEKDDFMAYGSEAEHLTASLADSALGNLQGYGLHESMHWQEFHKYLALANKYPFKTNMTIFSADKDDPRFDDSFVQGSVLRYFMATFFKALPSYNSLGFEMRDIHKTAANNEHYTKLYVFQYDQGPKATHGPYQFGENAQLWAEIQTINAVADRLFSVDIKLVTEVLSKENTSLFTWQLTIDGIDYVAIVNTTNAEQVLEKSIATEGVLLSHGFTSELASLGSFGFVLYQK
jgi:hypothetical protein